MQDQPTESSHFLWSDDEHVETKIKRTRPFVGEGVEFKASCFAGQVLYHLSSTPSPTRPFIIAAKKEKKKCLGVNLFSKAGTETVP
jgi:hypothetical protein